MKLCSGVIVAKLPPKTARLGGTMRKVIGLLAILVIIATGCGSEGVGPTYTIEVDAFNREAFNLGAIAYFPDELTVHPGATVTFHSTFTGEPHTVTLGTTINSCTAAIDKAGSQNEEGPPPKECETIPFFIDDFNVPPDKLVVNQAAAQPCFTESGTPGKTACPKREQPEFTGTQTFYNSGWLADDENFTVRLADGVKPGTYEFFCLLHGPEMRGKIKVVAESEKAQTPEEVKAAANTKIDQMISKVQPAVAKAMSPPAGTVKGGIFADDEETPAGAFIFSPDEISVPVGGKVTWEISGFHTVAFNFSEADRIDVIREPDGTVKLNTRTFVPAHSPPLPAPSESDQEPAPVNIDGGQWNGDGFLSSGAIDQGKYTLAFTKAGTYKYVCLVHLDMDGLVKVG